MQDSSLDKMVDSGLASRAEFTDQLSKLFIAYKTEEGINPVALVEKINARTKPLSSINIDNKLTATLAVNMLDNPSATFEDAKNKLGRKMRVDTGLELAHMKSEVLAAMLRFVLNNPSNEKSQAIVEAIYTHGSEQDRALLTSIGKKSQTGALNQAWQSVTGVFGMSTAPTAVQIVTTKQSKQKEIATLLAGTPRESDTIQTALEPLINRHGYSLSLNSPGGKPEKGKIYLEKISDTSLKYTVLDPQGKPQVGTVSVNQLVGEGTDSEKYNRGRRLQAILRGTLEQKTCEEEILPGILKLAVNAGHAHIDLSFIDNIQNENIQRLFQGAQDLTDSNLEKIDTLEKISHKDLPRIAAELETIELCISSLRYTIEATGDTLSSDQKAALYRQINNLNTALIKAQTKIADAMIQRLDLLDPEALKNLNPSEYDKEYYCDTKTKKLLRVHEIDPIPEQLTRLQHISTNDIIKYLLYIAKVGTNEQRLALYKVLPDKVKTSNEAITQWLENKLKDWGQNFSAEDKKFLSEFITEHKNLYQSPKDVEKGEMTISQDDFFRLCTLVKAINSYNNKDAMMKVIQEATSIGYFENRENFKDFCEKFSPTTPMGTELFNRLVPQLGENVSILDLISNIKSLEKDHVRIEIINKIMDRYPTKITPKKLRYIMDITNRENNSQFSSMPASFLEELLKENDDLKDYYNSATQINGLLIEMPFIAILGNNLTPKEIQNLIGAEPKEGENLEAILQNAKTKLGESSLHFAGNMLEEMQKKKLISTDNKEEMTNAATAVLAIINITNNILKNLPLHPENTEALKDQFTDLLVELKFFKEKYGDNPQTRSVLHHTLKNLCSESNLNLLVEDKEPYKKQDLQFFLAALRRMEKISEAKPKPEATSSTGPAINIELNDEMPDADERNIQLVERAFRSADAYLQIQKAEEADKRVFEELKKAAADLIDVATHPGHSAIETIKASQAISKLTVGTKLKIAGLNFQIAVLSFCEVFHKYSPRQRLIEKLEGEINDLKLGKSPEQAEPDQNQDQTPTSASNEEGIRTKPEDRPPPPTESLKPPETKDRPAPPDHPAPEPPEDEGMAPKQ